MCIRDRPIAAYKLAKKWRIAELNILPNAGHALSEEPVAKELVHIMNDLSSSKTDLWR